MWGKILYFKLKNMSEKPNELVTSGIGQNESAEGGEALTVSTEFEPQRILEPGFYKVTMEMYFTENMTGQARRVVGHRIEVAGKNVTLEQLIYFTAGSMNPYGVAKIGSSFKIHKIEFQPFESETALTKKDK
jgi:hypothetical protein